MTYRGVVKDNVVILEEGAHLPEGAIVEVKPVEPLATKLEAIKRVLNYPITKYVGIDEVIEEDKQEREKDDGQWLRNRK